MSSQHTLKLIKLGLSALRNNFVSLDRPYKLNFSITYLCQSRCLTCNIWQLKPKGELTLDEIKKFAERNNYFKWIGITGGEPFMRNDIVEIIGAFKQNCKDLYVITIPTNSLSNREMVLEKIEKILKLGIPKLTITLSLDGYRELHDKVRGVPGNFDKVMDMARSLKELQKKYGNLFFIFGYTISKLNQGSLEATYNEVSKEIGELTRNKFHVNVAQVSKIYYNNQDDAIQSNQLELVNELGSFVSKRKMEIGVIPLLEGVFLKKLVEYAKTGKPPLKSKSLDASLFLDSYGNVYPSIMWDKKIGNIRDTNYDLLPIWQSIAANEIRKMIKNGLEPNSWTSCEAYQSIAGNIQKFTTLFSSMH